VRAVGIDLRALIVGFGGVQVGLSGGELRGCLADLCLQLFFIQFGQYLTLLYAASGIRQQSFYDSAGLGLDLYLRNRLDLTGGDHALGQITLFYAGDLRRIDFGAAASGAQNGYNY